MMCCVGLVGGLAVGQALGGPWTFAAPAAGFAVGLVADMKMMKGHRKAGAQQAETETESRAKADAGAGAPTQGAAAAPAAESGAGCGIASGAMRMLGMNEKKENGGTTVAESGKTYQGPQ